VNASAERREILAQRTTEMRDLIARMDGLDKATILSSIDPVVVERLSSDRFMPRLVMRRGRRIAANGLFAPASGVREKALLDGGDGFIEMLCHSVGAHILWQEVIRLVRRLDVDALNDALGIPSREIALAGRDEAFGVTPLSTDEATDDLAERARREGAVSWACWLTTCDAVLARQLRIFTPESVSSLVLGALPENPEQRKLRRYVVEFELDRILALRDAETSEEQVL